MGSGRAFETRSQTARPVLLSTVGLRRGLDPTVLLQCSGCGAAADDSRPGLMRQHPPETQRNVLWIVAVKQPFVVAYGIDARPSPAALRMGNSCPWSMVEAGLIFRAPLFELP